MRVAIDDRDVPIARFERIEATGSGADRLTLLRTVWRCSSPQRSATITICRSTEARGHGAGQTRQAHGDFVPQAAARE